MTIDPGAGPLLDVRDLRVEFRTRYGTVGAVDGVSLAVDRGETLAVLGESGSGKSVTVQAVMGLVDSPPGFVTGGQALFDGEDLLTMPEARRRRVRGERIGMIFQDALTALNPTFTVGFQIAEMFRVHRRLDRPAARERAAELLDRVHIPAAAQRVGEYPHQLSGGMRQRGMIAMALALEPDLLIADEPTTALDVTVQAQITDLLGDLQADRGLGLVLITHDLGVVAGIADRVAVMYAGRVVETGPTLGLYREPAHPYTAGLTASIPQLRTATRELRPIPGTPPNLLRPPPACRFHPRCPLAREVCREVDPPLREVAGGRRSACHFAEEVLDGALATRAGSA